MTNAKEDATKNV